MLARQFSTSLGVYCLLLGWAAAYSRAAEPAAIVWTLDRTDSIGGHKPTVKGEPKVIDAEQGKAVAFDGRRDALVVPVNPLAGLAAFTVEAIFRPDAGGAREQRFIHIQDEGERRAMLEIRLLPDGWYADTFLRSGRAQRALNDPKLLHPAGRWHNLTLVYDGQQMTQYVNGQRELSARVAFQPMEKGQVSLGARLNDVFWFQGAILKVRFTPRAISPDEFLKAPEK